jgi:hypothetical protein
MPVHKTRISKWIRMLESGEFTQTTNVLRREYANIPARHCCLGVACELYAVEHGGYWSDAGEFVAGYSEDNWERSSDTTLPWPVQDWFGLDDTTVRVALVTFNDDCASFKEIAWFLRRWLVATSAARRDMESWSAATLKSQYAARTWP